LRYLVIFAVIDAFASLAISLILSGGIDSGLFLGYLGDLTLLETVAFFLLGASAGLYDVAASRPSEDEEGEVTRVPSGRGGWVLALVTRRRVGTEDESGEEMIRALTYVACDVMLFALTVVLAKLAGY